MPPSIRWQAFSGSRWRRHFVPGAVWLAAAGAAGWLLTERAGNFMTAGLARGEQRQIATETSGRLLLLPVNLFEPVRAGQTLAVLEDERIQARLATAAAEVTHLQAELVATADRLVAEAEARASDAAADSRRFAVDVEATRIKALALTTTIEADRITLQRMQFRLDRMLTLRDAETAASDELDDAQIDHAALQKQIEENTTLLEQLHCDLEEAVARRDAFLQLPVQNPAPDTALEPLRAAVSVQERRVAEVALERAMLVLRSPIDGVVSEVLRRPGESVLPGQPILIVAAPRPAEIVAYASPAQMAQVTIDRPLRVALVRPGQPPRAARSRVLGVGPTAEQLPARLWQNPAVPEWGWPIAIAVPRELPLLPGEVLVVQGL
jgi:membrane fusion protein, multidrug efflux system